MLDILIWYASISAWFFALFLFFGYVLKKDLLHGGVKLGMGNSIMLAVFWPLTVICVVCGWMYDMWQAWKKI